MKRKENDAYYTPEWLVNEFLYFYRLNYGIRGSILEPCCGNGAISNSLEEIMVHGGLGATIADKITKIVTNDIDKNVKADSYLKAQELLPKVKGEFDWIITNPPFNQAHEIVPLAYESAKEGIVMLLRLTYLEPCKNRADWLSKHPPTNLIVNKRISFTGDGKTDSVPTAWVVWNKNQLTTNINFIY